MTRYFEMDFDNGTVTEYARHGECNQCGACCIAVVSLQVAGHVCEIKGWDHRNGGNAPGDTGRWQAVLIDGHWRFWRLTTVEDKGLAHKCVMLSDNNRCRIHAGKTLLSREWPMSPSHVEPFSECSYSFTEIGHWTVQEFYKDAIQ